MQRDAGMDGLGLAPLQSTALVERTVWRIALDGVGAPGMPDTSKLQAEGFQPPHR